MKKTFLFIPFVLLLSLFFVSCEKEISFENGGAGPVAGGGGSVGGTSVYTFSGGTGTCTGAIVTGSFTAGIPANASNTVALQVDISTPGTYTLTSPSVNGVSFSGSGTFTATGIQTITLTASGTPVAAGIFNFVPVVSSCAFSITVDPAVTPDGEYYYDLFVNGINFSDTANTGDYGYYTSTDGFVDSTILGSGVTPVTDPIPAGETSLIIKKGVFYNYGTASDSQFKNFFAVGNYEYAPVGWNNGISIEWGDGNGKYWSTENAPGIQTGSSFRITAVEDDNIEFPTYGVRVTAEFNCKVYDDAGNSKTITAGKYVGVFLKD